MQAFWFLLSRFWIHLNLFHSSIPYSPWVYKKLPSLSINLPNFAPDNFPYNGLFIAFEPLKSGYFGDIFTQETCLVSPLMLSSQELDKLLSGKPQKTDRVYITIDFLVWYLLNFHCYKCYAKPVWIVHFFRFMCILNLLFFF